MMEFELKSNFSGISRGGYTLGHTDIIILLFFVTINYKK